MRHYKLITTLTVILITMLSTSCTSTKYFSIDILKPAKVSFPRNIVNVAIVDNAGAEVADSIYNVHLEREAIISVSKNSFKHGLVKYMNDEEYFHEVMLYPTVVRTDKNYGMQLPLVNADIRSIAHEMDADAIISLDLMNITTQKIKQTIFDSGYMAFNTSLSECYLLFRIYNAKGEALAPAMTVRDTIWRSTDTNQYDKMQSHQKMALRLASKAIDQLIPHWQSQERWYYTDGTKLMKQADKHAMEGKWEQAAKIWGAAFENEKGDKKKGKIALNIAVANENLGDVNNAATWIRVSSNLLEKHKKTEEYKQMSWYKVKLLERERDNAKVLDQLGVEPENAFEKE